MEQGELFFMLMAMAPSIALLVLVTVHLNNTYLGNYFILALVGLLGWLTTDYLSNIDLSYSLSLFLNQLIFFTTTLFVWALVLFSNIFPEDKKPNKKLFWSVSIFSLVVSILVFTPYFIDKLIIQENIVELEFGWAIIPYIILVLFALFYSIIFIIVKRYREKNSLRKKTLSVFIWAVAIFLFLGFTTNLLLPVVFGEFNLTILTPLYIFIFAALIFWAILRHKFLSIKTITTELFIFALWMVIIVRLAFSDSTQDIIFNSLVLLFVVVLGVYLIKSVKKEVEQRRKLQTTTKALEKANKRLKELDKLKTEFISLATHQLRSPITAIKGYTSMLIEGSFGEVGKGQKDALGRVFQSSQNMSNVIEDFLNVTKIEQGGMKYDFQELELVDFLEETVREFKISAEAKGLNLLYKKPDKKAMVQADNQKLRQVFANLIDNAIKYTEAGQIEVDLQIKEKEVIASVSDTGAGIDKDSQEFMFEKFGRTSSGKMNTGGSGLGLYLAKKIVEDHGGEIWFESEGENQGTTFFVALKVIETEKEDSKK